MQNHDVVLSKTEQGVVAFATQSPYFCFVAGTEDAVLAKVRQGLDFYHGLGQRTALAPRKSIELTPLMPSRRVSVKELEAA